VEHLEWEWTTKQIIFIYAFGVIRGPEEIRALFFRIMSAARVGGISLTNPSILDEIFQGGLHAIIFRTSISIALTHDLRG